MFKEFTIRRPHAKGVDIQTLPSGHCIPQEVPDESLREMLAFFRG